MTTAAKKGTAKASAKASKKSASKTAKKAVRKAGKKAAKKAARASAKKKAASTIGGKKKAARKKTAAKKAAAKKRSAAKKVAARARAESDQVVDQVVEQVQEEVEQIAIEESNGDVEPQPAPEPEAVLKGDDWEDGLDDDDDFDEGFAPLAAGVSLSVDPAAQAGEDAGTSSAGARDLDEFVADDDDPLDDDVEGEASDDFDEADDDDDEEDDFDEEAETDEAVNALLDRMAAIGDTTDETDDDDEDDELVLDEEAEEEPESPPPATRTVFKRVEPDDPGPVPAPEPEGPDGSFTDAQLDAAAQRLGIRSLHDEQRTAIRHALSGGDGLVVLPTGYGKSACYQIPSLLLPTPVVVVSPLLALLEDQVRNLQRRGVPVVRLDGTVRGKARAAAIERIIAGGPLLVMTTPETLAGMELLGALARTGISLFAVDEAHCASEWGHDFRPAYLRLAEMLERYGRPPVLAVTATATENVRQDLVRILDMKDPQIIVASPHRPNLGFEVIECGSTARLRALTRLVLRLRRPGIVYCSTTKDVDAVHGALKAMGIPSHRYHGGLKGSERKAEQEVFMKRGRRLVMVATSAFGLGIDKPDIRYVVHFQTPASLEQYVQEAGRAGRDGRPSHCILLNHFDDRDIHEFLAGQSRVRPTQLYQLVRALTAWMDEDRQPDINNLAASAQLAQRVTAAVVAVLESAGLVEFTDEKTVVALVDKDELTQRARRLTEQFDRLRKQDKERLDAIQDYADSDRCRAQLLREYFDVDTGEACGICDICREAIERPGSFFEPLRQRKGKGARKKKAAKKRRAAKRTRGRGRPTRRRRGPGEGEEAAEGVAAAGEARPARSRNRRRGRGRKSGARARGASTAGSNGGEPAATQGGNGAASEGGGAKKRARRRRGNRSRRRGRARRGQGQRPSPEGDGSGAPDSGG